MTTKRPALNLGDAVSLDGKPGIWVVVETAAQKSARNPRHSEWIRAHLIFDGAGPSTLAADHRARQATLLTGAHVAAQRDDGAPADIAYRLTLGRGTVVIVPRRSRAHTSDQLVIEHAQRLQHDVGLTPDAVPVERTPDGWQPAPGWQPVTHVIEELLPEVRHHHVYYDDVDGEQAPVVVPCRTLASCPTSIGLATVVRSDLDATVDMPKTAAEAAILTAKEERVDYGMRCSDVDGAPVVVDFPSLAYGIGAVSVMRTWQQHQGNQPDAELVIRRRTPGADWVAARIAPAIRPVFSLR
ncbi:hypothetical protein [Streptosporangium sp. CA-115845]|uniref:hypothetical protein n=1 Tax=Streptosporangium sp. CA-115845 TaxID=3240071 RepID=UPI003D8D8722